MAIPPKIPRPIKGKIQPLRADQTGLPYIGLTQEKLIGRVIVEWSKLEASLQDLIWALLKLDMDDGRVLTERTDAVKLLGILRVLVPRKITEPLLTEVLSAIAEADILRDDRNFIGHGTWGILLPENIPIALSLRAKGELGTVTSEHFPHERMHKIVHDIVRVKQVFMKAILTLDPSHGK